MYFRKVLYMEFIIDITPLSYYSYMKQNKFRKYISKNGRKYKEDLQKIFKEGMKNNEIIDKHCKLDIVFYFNNKRKNDLDNFAKPIMDAMNEIVYVDDSLVVDLRVRKYGDDYSAIKGKIIIYVKHLNE